MATVTGIYKLSPNPAALARLAAGSAITIAAVLTLPDAIALAPIVSSPFLWLIKLWGAWSTAAILWFSGFWVALLLGRLISGPILISNQGIKMWRLGKLLSWDAIAAVTLDEQNFFAKLFFLKQPVYKLTLYARHGRESMSPVVVPSFPFSLLEFESLATSICRSAQGFIPDGPGFALCNWQDQTKFRQMHKRTKLMRLALSTFILFGLIAFIARKTTVAYEYNIGMKELRVGNYATAVSHLQLATKTDPAFAIAWDKLAWAESKLHNELEAERSWHKALLYKPDLVESKIGLAELNMEHGDFASAEKLLDQCVRLSPYQTTAYLDLSKLYRSEGKDALSLNILDIAAKNAGRDIRSCLDCALLYKQYGLAGKARERAEFVLHINPENVEARQLLDQLGRSRK